MMHRSSKPPTFDDLIPLSAAGRQCHPVPTEPPGAADGPQTRPASGATDSVRLVPRICVPRVVGTQWRVKRAIDVILATLALLVTAPVFAVAAAAIKLSSPGPVFFRQRRIGWGGEPFDILKFRTMHQGAQSQGTGSVTIRNDPRVFPAGRLLRLLKIDELPQLINVLQGTMSLVGPRPTVLEDYQRMNPEQQTRCAVRPGITGLAQISGNASIPWPRRIAYDLEYIRGYALWKDLVILARTVWLVLTLRADAPPPGQDEWEEFEPPEATTATAQPAAAARRRAA